MMDGCSRCGAKLDPSARFCSGCGLARPAALMPFQTLTVLPPVTPGGPVIKGFGQVFGIDPRMVFLAFVLDTMLFSGEVLTFGALTVLSFFAGAVLAFITYKAQMRWYGDDREAAIIKGCILGLLTAIPTPVPAFVYLPSGVVGLFHKLFGKKPQNNSITT